MHFPIFTGLMALLTFIMAVTAIPVDQSPANPLVPEATDCKSEHCVLVTLDNPTYDQLEFDNLRCQAFSYDVLGVSVGQCFCILFQ